MNETATSAMELIKSTCFENPESVIALAIKFKPEIASVIADTRKAPGPLSGVAAIAVKLALAEQNKEVAEMNIICFSSGL